MRNKWGRIKIRWATDSYSDFIYNDDTELFKQFIDNESFSQWRADSVFNATSE